MTDVIATNLAAMEFPWEDPALGCVARHVGPARPWWAKLTQGVVDATGLLVSPYTPKGNFWYRRLKTRIDYGAGEFPSEDDLIPQIALEVNQDETVGGIMAVAPDRFVINPMTFEPILLFGLYFQWGRNPGPTPRSPR